MYPLTDTARKLLNILIWSLSCIALGYAWRYHQDSVKEAAHEATQQTAQVGVAANAKAIDTLSIAALDKELHATQAKNTLLQQKLNEARYANPPSDACRLPDGVRDELNRQLSTR